MLRLTATMTNRPSSALTVPSCHLQEDFLDLTVCVCGVCSLEEALWNMFVEEELFEGNNLYRCARCDRLVTAAKVTDNFNYPNFFLYWFLCFNQLSVFFFLASPKTQLYLFMFWHCLVRQAEETASIHDNVFAEIQLWLCQMWAIQGDGTLQLPPHHQPTTLLWRGTRDFSWSCLLMGASDDLLL